MSSSELDKWQEVRKRIDKFERVTLGSYSSELRQSPRRILFQLSRYKFAARLLGEGKFILEVGCSDGLGTLVLSEFAEKVIAVDIDRHEINDAKEAFPSEKIEFRELDFLNAKIDLFDGVVSLDVIEHIYPENETVFFDSVCQNLKEHGICVIGTPNKTAEQYASEGSRIGHINLYTWDRLKKVMENYFYNVFLFSMNDEVVHTGFYPMAHYLMALGVTKKSSL